jgi:uncharacterized protein YndB with AHSA1/START domain
MTHPFGDRFGTERATAARAVQASIEIAAPPEVVFRALADPRELVAWLGDAPASNASSRSPSTSPRDAENDAEVGEAASPAPRVAHPQSGAGWRAHVRAPDGTPGTVSGAFTAVVPPRSLTTTWSASWNRFAQDEVTFELVAIDVAGAAGTRVTVTHRRGDAHLHLATTASAPSAAEDRGEAWAGLLARLAMYVATTNALSYYGIGSDDDVARAFGALHRRVVAIHQGDPV